MNKNNHDEMPPRPPLSVPFPLQLGDEFHLGSATSFVEHERNQIIGRSEDDRVPTKPDETERTR